MKKCQYYKREYIVLYIFLNYFVVQGNKYKRENNASERETQTSQLTT